VAAAGAKLLWRHLWRRSEALNTPKDQVLKDLCLDKSIQQKIAFVEFLSKLFENLLKPISNIEWVLINDFLKATPAVIKDVKSLESTYEKYRQSYLGLPALPP
jgi:hypothetical protein